ncbi:MAG TPA: hypothetical protein VFW05_19900 [Verrucomicrobiae bacterium]|nr:hypothetical protein [Verrucomicrobiae bacterium]
MSFRIPSLNTTGRQSPQNPKTQHVSDHKQALAILRSKRFWKWFFPVWFPAACAIAYRIWVDFSPIPVIGGTFISIFLTAALLQSLLRGRVISNVGIFRRRTAPVRFWFEIMLLGCSYCFVVIGILMA